MDPTHGADELDLDEQITNFEQPLAIVPANQQGTRRHGTSCTWAPVLNANAVIAQLFVASQQQAPENRIPGPAGHPATLPNGSGKSIAYGGGAGGWSPAEFLSSEWQAGLRLLDLTEFQENHPLLQGNTVQFAVSLKESGIIPRLLLYIVAMQHAHNGESYVKFRDPSGTIGGTFVADVLSVHQSITRGAVVLLEKVTVLKTPPPHSLHHLCIASENVVGVIPRQRSGQSLVLPLFSSPPGEGEGDGSSSRMNVIANAGQQEPPARLINHPRLQQPSQLQSRNVSLAMQVPPPQQRQEQQQQRAPAAASPPPQQPSSYVQPRVDTADDLLDGLDDEFAF